MRRPEQPAGSRRWALWQVLGVTAAAIASMATTMAEQHPFPLWRVDKRGAVRAEHSRRRPGPFPYVARRASHGVAAEIWIVRSGKSGIGVALRLKNQSDKPRLLTIVGLRLRLENSGEATHPALSPLHLASGAQQTLYAGLPFDNERIWNEGWRQGELEVHLSVGVDNSPEPRVDLWRIPLVHDWKATGWVSRKPTFEPPKPRHRQRPRRQGPAEAAPRPPADQDQQPPAETPSLPPPEPSSTGEAGGDA